MKNCLITKFQVGRISITRLFYEMGEDESLSLFIKAVFVSTNLLLAIWLIYF